MKILSRLFFISLLIMAFSCEKEIPKGSCSVICEKCHGGTIHVVTSQPNSTLDECKQFSERVKEKDNCGTCEYHWNPYN